MRTEGGKDLPRLTEVGGDVCGRGYPPGTLQIVGDTEKEREERGDSSLPEGLPYTTGDWDHHR